MRETKNYEWGRESKVRNSRGQEVESECLYPYYINRNNEIYYAISLVFKSLINHIENDKTRKESRKAKAD